MTTILDTNFSSTQIFLDSSGRDNPTDDPSLSTFTLQTVINLPPNINMLINLSQFNIPKSWYNVNSFNNTLIWQHNAGIISSSINKGNYDASTLETELNALTTMTWTYNIITDKYDITGGGTDFTIFSCSACNILGFSETSHTSTASSLSSNQVVCINSTSAIFVKSNISNQNWDTRQKDYTDLLAIIQTDIHHHPNNLDIMGATGNLLLWQNSSNTSFLSKMSELSYITIELQDDKGNRLELNGVNWSGILNFDFVYNRIYDNQEGYLNIPHRLTRLNVD